MIKESVFIKRITGFLPRIKRVMTKNRRIGIISILIIRGIL